MQTMETTLDLSAIFEMETFDAGSYRALKELAFAGTESINRFLELVSELQRSAERGEGNTGAAALKLGMSYVLLGDNEQAAAWLSKAPDSPDKARCLGRALREQRRYEESVSQFELAAELGADKLECDCARAESALLSGNHDKALQILEANADMGSDSAEWHFVKGRYLDAKGDWEQAIESLEAALQRDADHAYATFHLGYLLNLHGADERAKGLFVTAARLPVVRVGALINLAVIYEDECNYAQAARCLRRVLAVDPNHARANLYLRDVRAAETMFIDEQKAMDTEKHNAVLDIPVSDFELSVRSRNCLKKMNIHTLGDLLRTSEAELLSYKNFGETSLKEIKAMLTQKGLVMGQLCQEGPAEADGMAPAFGQQPDSDISAEDYNRPVSALTLSVRARKCLQVLNIMTIGELSKHSEAMLLSSRNFGQTSLDEIKQELSKIGVELKPN